MHKRIIVAAFLLLSALPVASMLLGVGAVLRVDENRKLATPPSWAAAASADDFVRKADTWFSDHFGLRSLLIRLKTQIDYSVFGTSNRVHIGHNGWMFYRSVMDREKPMVEGVLRENQVNILRGISTYAAALDAKGIRLIVTVNLLADRFVPEQLPRSRPNLPLPPRMDSFLAELAKLEKLDYVDATTILKEVGKTRPAFHKTDFHWNDPAAFEVARAVLERIALREGRTTPVWKQPLDIREDMTLGGIATFMPLFWAAPETALFLKPSYVLPPGLKQNPASGVFEWSVTVEPPQPELLPATVVGGDSFFDGYVRSGFQFHFNELWRIRWGKLSLSQFTQALPPGTKYVVIQFIEVNLGMLLQFGSADEVGKALDSINRRQ